jgi:hypothetical protein
MVRPNVDAKASLAMGLAIKALIKNKIAFEKKTEYQLKVGDLSFYPIRGTIYRDGDLKALPEKGLEALIALVRTQSDAGEVGQSRHVHDGGRNIGATEIRVFPGAEL